MEFRGFKYSFDRNSKRIGIHSLKEESEPVHIGKFISLQSEKKIESLIKGEMYAPEVGKLNDLSEGLQFDTIAALVRHKEQSEENHLLLRQEFEYGVGILSFTTKPLSLPMWGLYTDNCGFYVEYDSKKLIESIYKNEKLFFSNLCSIRYEEDYKDFVTRMVESLSDHHLFQMAASLHTKFSDWKFEHEKRIIVINNEVSPEDTFATAFRFTHLENTNGRSRKLSYDIDSISRIIFGYGFISAVSGMTKLDDRKFKFPLGSLGGLEQMLDFCIVRKIPTFHLGMNRVELEIKELTIEKEQDGFVLLFE